MVCVNSKKLCKYELIISIDIAGTWIKYLPLLSFCNNHNLAVVRRMYDKVHTKKLPTEPCALWSTQPLKMSTGDFS